MTGVKVSAVLGLVAPHGGTGHTPREGICNHQKTEGHRYRFPLGYCLQSGLVSNA